MNTDEFAEALETLLVAQDLTVYLDVVPDGPVYPYVALFTDGGQRADESLAAQMERSTFYPRMTCVASVPKKDGAVSASLTALCATSLRRTRDRAFGILGREITAGGSVARIEHAGSSPAATDRDVPDRLVLYTVDTLKLAAYAV